MKTAQQLIFSFTLTLTIFQTALWSQTYCTSKGTQPWEVWLGRVHVSTALGSTSFPATQKEGYGDFTSGIVAPMLRNTGNLVTIEPKASWMGDARHNNLFWRVWIDFNKDGDFADADEQVISRQVVYQNQLFFDNEMAFTVPQTATLGNTRMRVAMKWSGYPTPCETFERGEVEDYTVQITEGVSNSCRRSDSLELVKIYNATNGANWTNKWNLNTPINTWYGVVLNSEGCVGAINLDGNGLVGTIPNLNMSKLEVIAMRANALSGTIPTLNCPKLIGIYFADSQLSGTIPVFNCPNLQYLMLYGNRLTGNFPNLSGYPNLRSLHIDNNLLTGSIPTMNFPQMMTCHLDRNQFTGTIPNFTFPAITELFLFGNQLSGCIPASMRAFCGKNVDISNNPQLESQNFAAFCSSGAGACAANVPDLVLENILAAPIFEIGVGHNLSYNIRNSGNAAATSISSYVYLSADNQLSSDDVQVSSHFISNLLVGEFQLVNHQIEIPPTWTYSNPYIIVKIAPLSNETNVANNNGSIAINVVLPTIPACSNSLGNGQLLCYTPNSDGSTTLIVNDGSNIIQKLVDKNGQQISSMNIGNAKKDSILVRNNQIIKKLANGTIAYTRNIAPSVLSRAPKIDVALEMSDGTFVLAGFQKYFDATFPPNNRDSLVLVTTDAQLNYLDHTIEARNQGPYNLPFDTCYQLFLLPNNQFLLSYGYGIVGIVTISNHNLVKYQKNNNALQRLKASNLGIGAPQTPTLVSACGNNLIFSINGSRYGQKGSFYGNLTTIYNLDSLIPLTLREVGQGSTDYYGSYKAYSYYYRPSLRDTAYRLSANFAGDPRISYNTFARLDIRFLNNVLTVPTHTKNIPFVQFEHIVRTGDTTCLVLGSKNGVLWVWNPDCGNTPTQQPDLIVANLTIPTPSVQRGQVLNWKVDIKNIGTGNASSNFNVKAYISTDNVLGFDDIQDGIIPTGNFIAGYSVTQVSGASTIPATLAVGNYYLILKVDADNQVTESNENNNVLVSTSTFAVSDINPSTNDIALTLTTTPSVYQRWASQNFTILAKNNGNQSFTNVKIEFKFPINTTNGGTATASVGIWQEWCAGNIQCFTWTIPTLPANATATLNVPVYVLNATGTMTATTKLLSSTPIDNVLNNNTATIFVNPATTNNMQMKWQPTQLVPVVIHQLQPSITEGDIVVGLESLDNREVQFGFYSTHGKLVHIEKRVIQKGQNLLPFDVSDLPQGIYFIQTDVGKGQNAPTKFVKL